MDIVKRINQALPGLFGNILKIEERALQESGYGDLSVSEIHTLEAIGTGKAKTMSQVAGILKITVGTLTSAINRLVKKGYAERTRIPEDRRIVKVRLTEKGRRAVEKHEQFHRAMVADAIAPLSREEAEQFTRSLENISEFFLMQRVKPANPGKNAVLKPVRMGDLSVPVPIFQGGMGIGVSMDRLAAAVAACGGVGVISAAHPGYREPDFFENPKEANLRALKAAVKRAREAVRDMEGAGPVGVNLVGITRDYEAYAAAAAEAGAQVILSGAGLPTGLPGLCREKSVKLIPIVSSARAAGLILKNWAKKYNRAPDALIFEGPLAGGHLGFKEEHLDLARENFYKTITEIKAELSGLENCPLIAGGGIFTPGDGKKALEYGADGILMGTRFVTTEECDADPAFKEAYLACGPEDIGVFRSPLGVPGRALRNRFFREVLEQGSREPILRCNSCVTSCNPEEAAFCITDALCRAVRGDAENGLVFCGANAWKCKKIETVEEIFREFARELGMPRQKIEEGRESDAEHLLRTGKQRQRAVSV